MMEMETEFTHPFFEGKSEQVAPSSGPIDLAKFLLNNKIINILDQDCIQNPKDDLTNLMNEEPQSPLVLNKNASWNGCSGNSSSSFIFPEGSCYEVRVHWRPQSRAGHRGQLVAQERLSSNSSSNEAAMPKQMEEPEISQPVLEKMELETAKSEKIERKSPKQAEEISAGSPQKSLSDDSGREIQKIGCNCKKSKCLKLYCECFANHKVCCAGCNCENCENVENKETARFDAMKNILARNPDAFARKIAAVDDASAEIYKKGCHCKKSGCKKKYCECWAAGIECNSSCKCEGCKNCDERRSRDKLEPESLERAGESNLSGELSTDASSSRSPEREQKKVFQIIKVHGRRRNSGQLEAKQPEKRAVGSSVLRKYRDASINC